MSEISELVNATIKDLARLRYEDLKRQIDTSRQMREEGYDRHDILLWTMFGVATSSLKAHYKKLQEAKTDVVVEVE